MSSNHRITTNFPGGLQVNIHNGPEAPNNRHFNPEVYWIRPAPAAPVANAPWIIRLRNDGDAPCIMHGFGAYREHAGGFINAAQTSAGDRRDLYPRSTQAVRILQGQHARRSRGA